MPSIPFVGRLAIAEYFALAGSFVLVALESIVRVLTLALPTSLLHLFYRASRRLFNAFTSPAQKKAEQRRKSVSTSIRDASDFVDLCEMYGYTAEEHVVQTKDGYLLGLHRLQWRKGEEDMKVNNGPHSIKKRVVYLHHGLMMNSEVWVCLTDAQRCLPFTLVERGFDVWLGNNRGNKYSKKSIHHPPTSTRFWNFGMDEFAFYDIPDSIEYVLEYTQQPSLSYVGFSQGTAQAFATLSIHPKLNDQVNVFIALAPAMSPAGLRNGIVDAMMKASPQILFLLFGRRSILSSATMWQSILYPPIFVKIIDQGLSFLFGWESKNMSFSQKLAAYPHLYSFTSTKSVVHWFQIIRNKCFQMYDDEVQTPLGIGSANKYTRVAKFPTRNIRTPIVLVYGGSDSLVDIKVMLRALPNRTVATEIPHYEHLDFLWARDVDAQVFQHVFDALDNFTNAENSLKEFESYRRARQVSISASASFRHSYNPSDTVESDTTSVLSSNGQENGTSMPVQHQAREGTVHSSSLTGQVQQLSDEEVAAAGRVKEEEEEEGKNRSHHSHLHPITTLNDYNFNTPEKSTKSTATAMATSSSADSQIDATDTSYLTTPNPSPLATSAGKTIGWNRRRGSAGSNLSLDSMKDGRGIRIGVSRPAGGVVTTTGSSDEGRPTSATRRAAGRYLGVMEG